MRRNPSTIASALGLLAGLLATGCGSKGAAEDAGGTSSASPAAAEAPAEPEFTVTHVLIAYHGAEHASVTRTQEEALRLAKSLIADVIAGRDLADLVKTFSDDKDSKGVPNSSPGKPPGTYVLGGRSGMTPVPEFLKAAKETPVGRVTPEPVKTIFGYHVIRRDK